MPWNVECQDHRMIHKFAQKTDYFYNSYGQNEEGQLITSSHDAEKVGWRLQGLALAVGLLSGFLERGDLQAILRHALRFASQAVGFKTN